MEPVTHLLTGACISRAGLNRTTGLATLTLVLAAEAPDLDGLARLVRSRVQVIDGVSQTTSCPVVHL